MSSTFLALALYAVITLPFAEAQALDDWQPVINMGEMVLPILQRKADIDSSAFDAAAAILQPRIQVRIAQLDSPYYAERERASEELALMGLVPLEALQEARRNTKSAEVLYRIDRYMLAPAAHPDFSKKLPPYKKE